MPCIHGDEHILMHLVMIKLTILDAEQKEIFQSRNLPITKVWKNFDQN